MATQLPRGVRMLITAGPSKWDWALSLMDGNGDHRRQISFEVSLFAPSIDCTIHAIINMACREDSSGESWVFSGECKVEGSWTGVNGCYSTKNRDGWIELQ